MYGNMERSQQLAGWLDGGRERQATFRPTFTFATRLASLRALSRSPWRASSLFIDLVGAAQRCTWPATLAQELRG